MDNHLHNLLIYLLLVPLIIYDKVNCDHLINVRNNSRTINNDSCETINQRNITLLERFQTRISNREKIFQLQEEQLNRENQIRNGIRSRSRTFCPLPSIRCFRSRYRTIDGTCNNLIKPRLGASGECVPRILPAEYGDRISTPKLSVTGRPLPNPRLISLALHSDPIKPSSYLTQLFMVFGQFLDHDMTFTPPAQTESGKDIECCPSQQANRGLQRSLINQRSAKWCYPIQLSLDDPFYARMGQRCMEFVRSVACLSCTWGPRYQVNEISSFIDGSIIYGSLLNETRSLRNFDGSGTLKVAFDFRRNVLLPRSSKPDDDGCSITSRRILCFQSGDSRVNQHAPLASLHTIWHRHHNRLARGLRSVNRHWDEERIFQEARRILAAQLQVVAYKEWLPLVLGPELMNRYDLNILSTGFTEYDPTLDPSITSEFNTAAFRFGHSLIPGYFSRVSEDGFRVPYRLKDNFFKPYTLREGNIDSIIRGLIAINTNAWGPGVDEDVRNHLYQTERDQFGGDLVAINIQRGRDHAIPGYISMVKYCSSKNLIEWFQLDEFMKPYQRARYQSIYSHIQDIDLFSAGISEIPLPGAVVGPTFACIIGNQFRNLRFGDRFWFEHLGQDGSFSKAQINNLRETSLAKIICANGDDFTIIHPKVFLPVSQQSNPLTPCSSLPDIDLSLWTEIPQSFTRNFV